MLNRTENRFGLKPGYLTADTAYGTAQNLAWLVKQKKITPHIPVCDKSTRTDGTFSRSDFTFDAEAKRYSCPAGKHLIQFRRAYTKPRTGVTAEGTRVYFASKKDCGVCHLKTRCCPNTAARKIPRNVRNSRDVARALAATPEFKIACRRRKKVEMLFAHLMRPPVPPMEAVAASSPIKAATRPPTQAGGSPPILKIPPNPNAVAEPQSFSTESAPSCPSAVDRNPV